MRNTNWSQTSLGAPETWPESLKLAVSISLNSGFPIAIYWGEDFTLLYNEAYSAIPGDKHPWTLGKPGSVAWAEIWDVLEDEFKSVMKNGDSIRRPDALLLMNRYGYTEECYFDYTLSPIFEPTGRVGGVFNAVIETTYKVISERRNTLLLSLLANLNAARSVTEALDYVTERLETFAYDIPYGILHMEISEKTSTSVIRYFGLSDGQVSAATWPCQGAANIEAPIYIERSEYYLSTPVTSVWGDDCFEAFIVPISKAAKVSGYMVFGISPRKKLDEDYRDFLTSVGLHVGTILNNAYNVEQDGLLQREQALNEELATTNEELITTNEELQATKQKLEELNNELEERVASRTKALSDSKIEQLGLNEKLQATNEELVVINEELANAQETLQNIVSKLAESESRIRYIVADAPVAIGLLTGKDFILESANHKILELWGKTAAIVGKPIIEGLPEIKEQPFLKILENVLATGQSYYGNEVMAMLVRNGKLDRVFFNFVYQPVKDAEGNTNSIMLVATDVTEQVNARRTVEESEERFRFLFNAIPQQVWTSKPDGALNYVNKVVSDDFGYRSEEIVGYGWQKFIHPDDLSNCLRVWKSALKTGNEYLVEFRLKFNDGIYRWHLSRALPFIEQGEIKLWVGTNTNIDVQKNNEQKKDEFISIASHELKTPLTSIKAFNQLMRRAQSPEKLKDFVVKSSDHIERLEKLISDLLDVSKINAGKLNYNLQQFSFKRMLEDSVESAQHVTTSHQIILENAVDIKYTGDHFRLEQVMNNFLTNAIKYSPNGQRILVNSAIEQDSIIVSVQDFGIGIEKNDLDRIFDRYYRVDNTAMRFEGLGLGLFISSEILKRHKGSFWIESEKDKGSTFFFRLPLKPENQQTDLIKTDRYYKDGAVTILYNKEKKRLEADWTGFQDIESVQRGCLVMLNMLKINNCVKVLNDNSHVMGTWSEASEWAGKIWMPMMKEAGLKYFAWIVSNSAFSQLSAKKSVDVMETEVTAEFFKDTKQAEQWIDSK